MNLRLQALKDMKEDLLMRKCKISDEIEENELELRIPVNEYNYNDVMRQILLKPIITTVQKDELKKRNPFPNQQDGEVKNVENIIEEEKHSGSQSESQDLAGQQQMKLKMIYTYKYKTKYGPILIEDEPDEELKQNGFEPPIDDF
jgi:hypothetical protein